MASNSTRSFAIGGAIAALGFDVDGHGTGGNGYAFGVTTNDDGAPGYVSVRVDFRTGVAVVAAHVDRPEGWRTVETIDTDATPGAVARVVAALAAEYLPAITD